MHLRLYGRKVALAVKNYDQTSTVAASNTETVTIAPAAGFIWRVKMLGINVANPSGATTGTHKMAIRLGISDFRYNQLLAESNYNNKIEINYGTIYLADVSKVPASEEAQRGVIHNLVISADVPLILYYANNTDVDQSNARTIRLVVEEEVAV